jgi:hypothetical protein
MGADDGDRWRRWCSIAAITGAAPEAIDDEGFGSEPSADEVGVVVAEGQGGQGRDTHAWKILAAADESSPATLLDDAEQGRLLSTSAPAQSADRRWVSRELDQRAGLESGHGAQTNLVAIVDVAAEEGGGRRRTMARAGRIDHAAAGPGDGPEVGGVAAVDAVNAALRLPDAVSR